jgi:drug/metabolite transporter (DMT)-like permease
VHVVILGTVTAALFGFSDFLGGLASRRDSAVAVTALAHTVGLAILVVGVWFFPYASLDSRDVLIGAVAGIGSAVGVTALYAALAAGRMSVVAPLTAALSGALPAGFDLVRGSSVDVPGIAGMTLALVAIVVVSATSSAGEDGASDMPPVAIALSLLAGLGFAGAILAFSFTAKDSGLWPMLSARAVSVPLVAGLAFARRGHVALDGSARAPAGLAGALDVAATTAMVMAIRVGPLAIASVLGSLYPVTTMLLARYVLGERMRPLQRLGVLLALVAVVLTALS